MNWQSQENRLTHGCELCGNPSSRELYTAKDRLRNSDAAFQIAVCAGCGVLRTLPEMGEAELGEYYTDNYWGAQNEPAQKWIESSQSDKIAFLNRCQSVGGNILDVGCGSGFFLRALKGDQWIRYGVEISAEAAAAAAQRIGQENIFRGTLLRVTLPEHFFDVITFWSSLEHTNEPRANLLRARQTIKVGGILIVQVPNAASYQAQWFKGDWVALDAPRHRYHFTSETLSRLLTQTGFELVRCTYFSKAHNAHALRQSLKAQWYGAQSSQWNRLRFLAVLPFLKPFDWLMSGKGRGATITLAARAV